jgi:ribonuclease HI
MGKIKFYVVWKGAKPGIYTTWQECSAQITGFTGALYKSFSNIEEAERALNHNPYQHIGKSEKITPTIPKTQKKIIRNSFCVDAAWNTKTKIMEYRGVLTQTGEEIFRRGPFPDSTNNIGEFLAIVHALALLQKSKNKMPVYSDSHTALVWVKNKRANTKLERTNNNAELFDLISRAEAWLRDFSFENPLIKWETKSWGEIPADFGRK